MLSWRNLTTTYHHTTSDFDSILPDPFVFTPAFLVLLPINYTGGVVEAGDVLLNDFEQWSLSNVTSASSRMWFHVLGIYILTYVVMWELRHECQYFIALRHEFLLGERPRM